MSENIMIRNSAAADKGQLIELWHEVFGDEPEFIEHFFRLLYKPEYATVAVCGGKIISAGYCIPGPMAREARCSYIYAVATDPAFRGRGAAAAVVNVLAENAFDVGADIVATLPASESLCPWYEKLLGMTPCFKRGGEGVRFPEAWREFAGYFDGSGEAGAPERLRACAREGLDPTDFIDLGWELTLD